MSKGIFFTIGALVIAGIAGTYVAVKRAPAPAETRTPPPAVVTNPEPESPEPPQAPAPPPQSPPAPTAVMVTYTDSGYSPGTMTVPKGTTVVFKNESSRGMWTASDIHPTHRAYPTTGGCLGSTFDECAEDPSGSSWSFKFDVVGTWRYHNHVSPSKTGTVVVQ